MKNYRIIVKGSFIPESRVVAFAFNNEYFEFADAAQREFERIRSLLEVQRKVKAKCFSANVCLSQKIKEQIDENIQDELLMRFDILSEKQFKE